MKSFDNWLTDLTEHINSSEPEDEDEEEILTSYPCVICEEDTEIYCDPEEFDPGMHYCGRTQWCCP